MAARFEGKELRERFQAVFGIDTENLTVEQAWVLVRLVKHVRLRCRSNNALNAYLNRNFRGLTFKQVEKEYNGRKFPGLQITDKTGKVVVDTDADDAD